MKETYRENLASSSGHEPYAGSSNVPGVAWGSEDAGQPLSSEIKVPVCRPCTDKGKATSSSAPRRAEGGHGGVVEPGHVSKFQAREPGEPNSICGEMAPQRWPGSVVSERIKVFLGFFLELGFGREGACQGS